MDDRHFSYIKKLIKKKRGKTLALGSLCVHVGY
jgi:hypothetical protein